MINATIYGNLGRDPEYSETGKVPFAHFSVATSHGWGDKKTTTWVKIKVFGHSATFARDFLRKGQKVVAAGSLYIDEWEGREGTMQTLTLDCQRLESASPREDAAQAGRGGKSDSEPSSGGYQRGGYGGGR